MRVPADILAAVKRSESRNKNDIDAAVADAKAAITQLSSYQPFVDDLITSAIRHMVQDIRHAETRTVKINAELYGTKGKVSGADSKSVQDIANDLYHIRIAGRTLGTMRGSELTEIADGERERGRGHLANAELCTKLRELVPDDKTVRQAVRASKLLSIWRECRKKNGIGGGQTNGRQKKMAAAPTVV